MYSSYPEIYLKNVPLPLEFKNNHHLQKIILIIKFKNILAVNIKNRIRLKKCYKKKLDYEICLILRLLINIENKRNRYFWRILIGKIFISTAKKEYYKHALGEIKYQINLKINIKKN